MSLKEKIALARDLQRGMKEATALLKYSCGKGTVHRVKKDLKVLLELDEEAVGNKKRKVNPIFENLDSITVINF